MTNERPIPSIAADEWLSMVQRLVTGEEAPAPLGEAERLGLLDLARVAAHTSERTTAPLSTYLAGLALASIPPAERAGRIADLVRRLDQSS